MRWAIEFGGDPHDAALTTCGEATPEGFARMNAEFVEDERFRAGMLVLLDHTKLDVGELSSEDVHAIANDFARHRAQLQCVTIALVAPEPVQFGLARMSVALAEPATPRIRVFTARAAALDWLRQIRHGRAAGTA
jgi:hypothetical protein